MRDYTDAVRIAKEIVDRRMRSEDMSNEAGYRAWKVPSSTLGDLRTGGSSTLRTLSQLLRAWDMSPAEFFMLHEVVRARLDPETLMAPDLSRMEKVCSPEELRWLAENIVRSKEARVFGPLAASVTAFLDEFKRDK